MNKPTYRDSLGKHYTTVQIDRKIAFAGKLKLFHQKQDEGYNFCTKCKKNDCFPIDVSHNISRKKAKETGTVEVLWDLDNLKILGRKCHKIKDGLDLKFTYNERS